MECLLQPADRGDNPLSPLVRVPYVARQRWDGGPFMTYPLRKGLPGIYFGGRGTAEYPWERRPDADDIPIEDLQTFFQEWLFFGLIVEALDGNTEVTSSSHLPPSEQPTTTTTRESVGNPCYEVPQYKRKDIIISRVYEQTVRSAETGSYISTETLVAQLQDSWTISLISTSATTDRLSVRCRRMCQCLRQAYYFYGHLPDGFDRNVKFAIGAIAEIIAYAMLRVRMYLKIDELCPNEWGAGYYQHGGVQSRMISGGWCPSDLIRTTNRFKYLQTFHYLSFLDKKRAPASHAGCTLERCKAGENASADAGRNHSKDTCSCRLVKVNHDDVVRALRFRDAIPLLVFKDSAKHSDTSDNALAGSQAEPSLEIEVVRSTKSTAYVAISHIWSDGLGNEFANSLNACKLRELRRLVQALPVSATNNTDTVSDEDAATEVEQERSLIWLDTLCCPVAPKEDKTLSLRKMRQVYEGASRVLVLDASLQAYSSSSMDVVEILARIFSSRWLRRVWTLQEGALAKQLWFQFADKAVCLDELKASMQDMNLNTMQNSMIFYDIQGEIDRIEQFFSKKHSDGQISKLSILDGALLHRQIKDLSDEPLCIGTLMDLPAKVILEPGGDIMAALGQLGPDEEQKEERRRLQGKLRDVRMQRVWMLLAKKLKSLPADIIFFEEAKLQARGFRWAPQSLLEAQNVYMSPRVRTVRWNDKAPGVLTNKGLKAHYPGFRLRVAQYDDGKPTQPWKGCRRVPEHYIIFRNEANGEWWTVSTKAHALRLRGGSPLAESSAFPLEDLIHQNGHHLHTSAEVFLVMSRMDQGDGPHSEKTTADGILTTGTMEEPSLMERLISFLPFSKAHSTKASILTECQIQVSVGPLPDALSAFYNTVERLALTLRAEECTDRLLALSHLHESNDEYKQALAALEQRMKDMMAAALREDEELRIGMRRTWGSDIDDSLWVFIGDWFYHDFVGTMLPDDQSWIID